MADGLPLPRHLQGMNQQLPAPPVYLTSLTRLPMFPTMKLVYSVYEAKARLSEILRAVRDGRRITITDRGRQVARVVPVAAGEDLEERLQDLQAAGVLTQPSPGAELPPDNLAAPRPGALDRFLADRE